jgi:type IV secretory pathway VirB10-like protein
MRTRNILNKWLNKRSWNDKHVKKILRGAPEAAHNPIPEAPPQPAAKPEPKPEQLELFVEEIQPPAPEPEPEEVKVEPVIEEVKAERKKSTRRKRKPAPAPKSEKLAKETSEPQE